MSISKNTNGAVLAGVAINVFNSSNAKVGGGTSDATGAVKVNGLIAGKYSVAVAAVPKGYQLPGSRIAVTMEAGKDKTLPLTIQKSAIQSWQLKNIKVSKGKLVPAFDHEKLSYTLNLDEKTEKVTLTPQLADANSKLYINAKRVKYITIGLKNGETKTVSIKVILSTHNTVYSVKVTRAKSTNANLNRLTVSKGNLKPKFNANVTEYVLNLSKTQVKVKITPKTADPNAQYTITVNKKSSKGTIELKPGDAVTVQITVKAQAGNKKTYKIIITAAKK
jgi:hypothetical protein